MSERGFCSASMVGIAAACTLCVCSFACGAQSCPQGALFEERAQALGLNFTHHAHQTAMRYPLEVMGSGVALFDFDNDGRLDVFFANGASFPEPNPQRLAPKKSGPEYWNRLYRQRADGSFEDVTEKAGVKGEGYSMGVAVGDFDNDGYEDLFVAGFPRNYLYHNNGDGTFTDVSERAGVKGEGWSTSAVWVDLDNDGLLDLVVLRYFKWNFDEKYCPTPDGKQSYCDPKYFAAIEPLVYRNDGNGHFTEVAKKMGLAKPGKGLGIAIGDVSKTGRMDLFVANDGMDEFLYRNKDVGRFEERAVEANVATDENGKNFAGMGVVFEDLNNDGLPDLVVGDLAMQAFAFYTNHGDGTFDYASNSSGMTRITMPHSAWGIAAVDVENRGVRDLIAAEGHVNVDIKKDNPQLNYVEPPILLRNLGKNWQDESACLGAMAREAFAGRGLATGDVDNDGRTDVVMTANDGRAYVLRNTAGNAHHWLTLTLVGTKSNRDAIGAEVVIKTAHSKQVATVTTGGSYESSGDKRVHFGLGEDVAIESIEILWPSGAKEVVKPESVDRFVTIVEGKGITKSNCGNKPCVTAKAGE